MITRCRRLFITIKILPFSCRYSSFIYYVKSLQQCILFMYNHLIYRYSSIIIVYKLSIGQSIIQYTVGNKLDISNVLYCIC